ncbi:MAG: glycosyl hydrolase [Candidatus Eremiobacteraeota bacterium]|nr:glycosyl hydrolase [Candidatus Eremiobacteraeota bacterium]
MKRFLAAVLTFFFAMLLTGAAAPSSPFERLTSKLHWRSIGPFIGGRVVAVAGVPSKPSTFYFGGVQGGVWSSDDYGQHWTNITDGKIPGIATPIGALAVAPSNPDVMYAGTGEADLRGDFASGDGIYKSTDAGKTWSYAGLRETHMTTKLLVDPRDANVVYAASMGHVWAPNAERGVFKTSDGGKTWRKVLFVDSNTGGVDLAMAPRYPNVVYAAMWQAHRAPWKLTSGGPGSGLFKTADGGAHWTKISANPGFARALLGRIGVSVAASDPRVVYAIVQADDGGVFRSGDGGRTWKRVNGEMKLRQRGFYYTTIFVDPANPQIAYAPEVDGVYKTTDGGKTFSVLDLEHGDVHVVWINPNDPKILLVGDDGGATVTLNGGKTWSTHLNQPTGQYYHVALDDQFPFHVFGAQQDEGAYEGASAAFGGSVGPGEWHSVALGEATFVAPEPDGPTVTYGSSYYTSFVRLDRVTGQEQNVSPWPRYISGSSAADNKYRFGWEHPIFFSPANPRELFDAAQVVFSSTDRGQTWSILSPDLTRNDPSTEGPSGGPIQYDHAGVETYPYISSLAVSPLDANVLWSGSSDGLVNVTTDHGAHWSLVTPPQLPQWAWITSIEPSHADKATAYLSGLRYMSDDFRPYVYKTADYGAHWTALTNGLPANQYVFAVREDPREPKLLFAGTRSTVYASIDGGTQWRPLTLDLPGVQVRDLAVDARQGQLVAATHGRAFWILDNLALLEQLARQTALTSGGAELFAPETAWLTRSYGGEVDPGAPFGENPQYGATVFFTLPADYDGRTAATLSFVDPGGNTIREFSLHLANKRDATLTAEQEAELDTTHQRAYDLKQITAVHPGTNVFQWDLRYPPAYDVPGFRALPTDDWPDTSDGPTILPGKYEAVLQYGTTTLRAPFTVQVDPRVHPAPGDLEARLTLEKQILDTMDRLDRAIFAATSARNRLPAAKRAEIDRVSAEMVNLNVHSSEADLMIETKIREQLAFFMNSLENAYARPTAAQYALYDQLKSEADAGIARLAAASQPQ